MKDKMTSEEFRAMFVNRRRTKPYILAPNWAVPPLGHGEFFISGEVRSSKNSHQIFWKKSKQGKVPFITSSAAVKQYAKIAIPQMERQREQFLQAIEGKPRPIYVEFFFYRETKQLFDFNNMTQILQDLMVKCGWIERDDVGYMLPVPRMDGIPYVVDKLYCGVIIRIL